MTRGKAEPARDRFLARVASRPGGCAHWTGNVNAQGYGTFNPSPGSKVYAHRWAYEQIVGPIPDGQVLDHLCHTRDVTCVGGSSCIHRRCVNPFHLEPIEQPENIRRGRPATKTHCVNGHEFDESNTARPRRGGRQCRRCAADRQRARKVA